MIIIDFSQVLLSTLMNDEGLKQDLRPDLLRHMIYNTFRSYKAKFGAKYGNLVFACDSKTYWRKKFFPYYKAKRVEDREASGLNWKLIFEIFDEVKKDLAENFPYKVIEVPDAEADDVIGTIIPTLSQQHGPNDRELIVSSDKDFLQLQYWDGVDQYSPSPMVRKLITTDDPEKFLREHIIKGDRGDGIPNILTADNVFLTKERQKSISQKKLADWVTIANPAKFCINDIMLHGYDRNLVLIDLSLIPENIKTSIIEEFNKPVKKTTKNQILNFLISRKLTKLIGYINDF